MRGKMKGLIFQRNKNCKRDPSENYLDFDMIETLGKSLESTLVYKDSDDNQITRYEYVVDTISDGEFVQIKLIELRHLLDLEHYVLLPFRSS